MTEPRARFRVGDVAVWELDGALLFAAGMQLDLDGAGNAYHPPTLAHPFSGRPPGLDDIRNAGKPGNWWGIVTVDGTPSGKPVIQGAMDPYPGFYVSQTALADPKARRSDPRRYVDSSTVPYISLPSAPFRPHMGLGDLAVVMYRQASSAAIWADVGPRDKLGEGSIALATALGIFRGVNVGHDARDVVCVLFPGSRSVVPWPRDRAEMDAAARAKFLSWGGAERVNGLYPYLMGTIPSPGA